VNTLKFHPFAELFPLLEGTELEALARDIKEHGQDEPILTYQGMILDGRNRWRACELVGVSPILSPFDEKTEESGRRVRAGWRKSPTAGQGPYCSRSERGHDEVDCARARATPHSRETLRCRWRRQVRPRPISAVYARRQGT
jgi:hypothetical protein